MTVDEMIDWLESAKRISEQSGQDISNYPVMLCGQATGLTDIDLRVDHGTSLVYVEEN